AIELLQNPQHPYTKRLIGAAPSLASRRLVSAAERAETREQAVTSARSAAAAPDPADAQAPEVGYAPADPDAVIEVQNLTKEFPIRGTVPWRTTPFTAVDDVSFAIRRGTTTAIVGESGSGKSTVAQMVLKLLEPTAGRVLFEGKDVTTYKGKELKSLRRRVQPIFQNPYGTLDPMYSIYSTIEEPLRLHGIGDAKSR